MCRNSILTIKELQPDALPDLESVAHAAYFSTETHPKGRAPPLEPGLLVVSTTTGMASMVEATPACASITAYEDATATAVAEPPGVASGCAAA